MAEMRVTYFAHCLDAPHAVTFVKRVGNDIIRRRDPDECAGSVPYSRVMRNCSGVKSVRHSWAGLSSRLGGAGFPVRAH